MKKTCFRCQQSQDIDQFAVRLRNKDGRVGVCRSCSNRESKQRADRDQLGRKAYMKDWRNKNRDKTQAYYAKQKGTNSESLRQSARKWRAKNTEKTRQYARNHYVQNREKVLARSKDRPKDLNVHYARMYQTRRLRACPKWLTVQHKQAIRDWYTWARILSEETGTPHHVDHIVPLKGRNVCGLHVPWNLQVITAVENAEKHAKF